MAEVPGRVLLGLPEWPPEVEFAFGAQWLEEAQDTPWHESGVTNLYSRYHYLLVPDNFVVLCSTDFRRQEPVIVEVAQHSEAVHRDQLQAAQHSETVHREQLPPDQHLVLPAAQHFEAVQREQLPLDQHLVLPSALVH